MCSAKKLPEGRTDFTGITFCYKFYENNIFLAMLHVPSLPEKAPPYALFDKCFSQDFNWPLTLLTSRPKFVGFKWFIEILSLQ